MSKEQDPAARRTTPTLALAALGVVYGDLGTSPLYTMQTVVQDAGGHIDASLALEFLGFAGNEPREGVASHKEKRPPQFPGSSPV